MTPLETIIAHRKAGMSRDQMAMATGLSLSRVGALITEAAAKGLIKTERRPPAKWGTPEFIAMSDRGDSHEKIAAHFSITVSTAKVWRDKALRAGLVQRKVFIPDWEQADPIVKRMWGEHSAPLIAKELGGRFTGPIVLRRAEALGLPKVSRARNNARPEGLPPKPKATPEARRDTPPEGAVTILHLASHHCRWPYQTDQGWCYCAQPKWNNTSWCEGHAARAHAREAA